MERSVAVKKLGKLLGKHLGYRVDPKAPGAEERARAAEEARVLSAQHKAVADAAKVREEALLGADAEYQRLIAKAKQLREAKDRAYGMSHHFRFTVGTSNGMFFHVKAQGDSWEDVIAQLTRRQNRPIGATTPNSDAIT